MSGLRDGLHCDNALVIILRRPGVRATWRMFMMQDLRGLEPGCATLGVWRVLN